MPSSSPPANANCEKHGDNKEASTKSVATSSATQSSVQMPPPKAKPRDKSSKTPPAECRKAKPVASCNSPADEQSQADIRAGEAQFREEELQKRISELIRDFKRNGLSAYTRDGDDAPPFKSGWRESCDQIPWETVRKMLPVGCQVFLAYIEEHVLYQFAATYMSFCGQRDLEGVNRYRSFEACSNLLRFCVLRKREGGSCVKSTDALWRGIIMLDQLRYSRDFKLEPPETLAELTLTMGLGEERSGVPDRMARAAITHKWQRSRSPSSVSSSSYGDDTDSEDKMSTEAVVGVSDKVPSPATPAEVIRSRSPSRDRNQKTTSSAAANEAAPQSSSRVSTPIAAAVPQPPPPDASSSTPGASSSSGAASSSAATSSTQPPPPASMRAPPVQPPPRVRRSSDSQSARYRNSGRNSHQKRRGSDTP